MKNSIKLILVLASFATISFNKAYAQQKFVAYGLVSVKECDTNIPKYYKYVLTSKEQLEQAKAALKERLTKEYPENTAISVGSSFFKFGTTAHAMVIYNYSKKNFNDCTFKSLLIEFGKDPADAYERAIKDKDRANISILESIQF